MSNVVSIDLFKAGKQRQRLRRALMHWKNEYLWAKPEKRMVMKVCVAKLLSVPASATQAEQVKWQLMKEVDDEAV